MPQPHVDPYSVQCWGPWVLIREDAAPGQSAGGIIIPGNARLGGRHTAIGTVISAGDGRGREGRFEMPPDGSRVVFMAIAELPDTSKKLQKMFEMDDLGGDKIFTIHGIDLIGVLEGDGPEPRVE